MTTPSELQTRYNDINRGVYFIGTTPPKSDTPLDKVNEIAKKLLDRVSDIDIDGLIVYDIQDENSRISKPRPFPFKSTHDTRLYSSLLNNKSSRPVITYKSVVQSNSDDFDKWANEAWEKYGVKDVVLVGSPSKDNNISLPLADAYKTLVNNPYDFIKYL